METKQRVDSAPVDPIAEARKLEQRIQAAIKKVYWVVIIVLECVLSIVLLLDVT